MIEPTHRDGDRVVCKLDRAQELEKDDMIEGKEPTAGGGKGEKDEGMGAKCRDCHR